jgi:hypothetical protein
MKNIENGLGVLKSFIVCVSNEREAETETETQAETGAETGTEARERIQLTSRII